MSTFSMHLLVKQRFYPSYTFCFGDLEDNKHPRMEDEENWCLCGRPLGDIIIIQLASAILAEPAAGQSGREYSSVTCCPVSDFLPRIGRETK